MSDFRVRLEQIIEILPITGADNIQSAKLKGIDYCFIIKKDQFKIGDKALYVPLDAVVPSALLQKIGLENKLGGSQHNRVRTMKLNKFNVYSEGLLVTPSVWLSPAQIQVNSNDYAELLQITKYVEEVRTVSEYIPKSRAEKLLYGARKAHWYKKLVQRWGSAYATYPDHLPHYDIEGARAKVHLWDILKEQPSTYITEKLEGMHVAFVRYADGSYQVCSRTQLRGFIPAGWRATLRPYLTHPIFYPFVGHIDHTKVKNHEWQHVWYQYNVQAILDHLWGLVATKNTKHITIKGEIVGPNVLGNIYSLSALDFYAFDIQVDHQYLKPDDFINAVENTPGLKRVPVLEWDSYDKSVEDVVTFANGQSKLYPTLREGIVLKPWEETYVNNGQRLILKVRDPQYLAKQKD